MSGEFLGDDATEKQYGDWKAPDVSGTKPPEQKQLKEPGEIENINEKFAENQLVVDDKVIETTVQTLKDNGVVFKTERWIEPAPVTDSRGNEVEMAPGQYVISVTDPEEVKPASAEFTAKVGEILGQAGVEYIRGRKAA